MKIAILGAGLIGKRRGGQLGTHSLLGIYDPIEERSRDLAEAFDTECFSSEEELFSSAADLVIIATTNNALCPLAQKALLSGKHVLLEKPGGISLSEILSLEKLSQACGKAVKLGFNLRFHPGLKKTKALIDQGALGELMFLRARYGHGGRLHMEKEWRFQPELSGGGELLDQGIHLLDLIYWFLGPLPLHSSLVTRSFWPGSVDDNAILTLKGSSQWASFHVSCSEWKNTFSLELYGRSGKVHVQGLGASYGEEALTFYQMLPEMGPPEIFHESFPGVDSSWGLDLENLVEHIELGRTLLGDLRSAAYAMEQIEAAYSANGFSHLPCFRREGSRA